MARRAARSTSKRRPCRHVEHEQSSVFAVTVAVAVVVVGCGLAAVGGRSRCVVDVADGDAHVAGFGFCAQMYAGRRVSCFDRVRVGRGGDERRRDALVVFGRRISSGD